MRLRRTLIFLGIFVTGSVFADGCATRIGALAWYQNYRQTRYAISYTGAPFNRPVSVIQHFYYTKDFITCRTEVRQVEKPPREVVRAAARRGLSFDENGDTIFAGKTRKESIQDAYRLMDLEREAMWEVAGAGWRRYGAEIEERIDFALAEYPTDWPTPFRDFLKASALQWENRMHSTYVDVFRRLPSGRRGERVGVFLNLSHPYSMYEIPVENVRAYRACHLEHHPGPLPKGIGELSGKWHYVSGFPARRLTVEEFFGAEVPLPSVRLADDAYTEQNKAFAMRKMGGMKSEPRNWRIKQGVSPQIFGEILLQYLMALYNPTESREYNEEGNFIYTYGTRRSVRRYAGFDPVTGDPSHNGGMGFELLSPTPVSRYGLDWWTLRSTPRRMLDNLISIREKRGWTEAEALRIREALMGWTEGEAARFGKTP